MVRVPTKVRRLLSEEGLVTPERWDEVASLEDPLEALFDAGDLEESALVEVVARTAQVAPIDLAQVAPDGDVFDLLDHDLCYRLQILPLTRNGDLLTIVAADPFDVLLFDDLRRRTGCQVRAVYAPGPRVLASLKDLHDDGSAKVQEMMDQVGEDSSLQAEPDEPEAEDIETTLAEGDDSPAVKLINVLLLKALREKASDIHIEPGDRQVKIRFRIDGRLREGIPPVSRGLLPALSSRLKILASLDIAERHAPQDGKFQIRYEGRSIDFRLSILPVVGGEKSVIRILDVGSLALNLDGMGWEPQSLAHVREAISQPYGMMLVTGPTGSGKSTTLYSCVQAVATSDVNVTTVEDPVEYRMEGINQVPVNPKRGITFAGALRSILRQDPDIVLVGEVRDKETADIAVKAALTGHLVLSTLHTNDAASTITRLVDMGVDPFMVSSSLLLICAQRLGRRLCKNCRVPVEDPPRESLLSIGFLLEDFEGLQLFAADAKGCGRCNGGYRGRFPVLETMPMTSRMRRLIVEGGTAEEVKRQALEDGLLSLRRVGLLNAIRGVTSVEEVLRITLED
ncbi:MAG TPA: secretion system protein E [Planctomycetes bacterium]|nr:secretion system protein E [Planctomycetota bacterium]HIL36871.1 secretion system protein E [Planctomycetota bacterium]